MNELIDLIDDQKFTRLFTEHLGWSKPAQLKPVPVQIGDQTVNVKQVANYHGLGVWHCPALPERSDQLLVDKAIAKKNTERLIIFTNETNQEWRWPRYSGYRGAANPRLINHPHTVGEANPSLLERLQLIEIAPGESVTVPELLARMRDAFDREAERASVQAARVMGALYEKLADANVPDDEASIVLARILFLMFGDDTNMWTHNLFHDYLTDHTNPNGTDLNDRLQHLFEVADAPEDERPSTTDSALADLPYINGGIFEEAISLPPLPETLRVALIEACRFDWGQISPAVFGSMFQTVKSGKERRELGEHYTTETNILKTIGPLFLDELHDKLEAAWGNKAGLTKLRNRLKDYRYLDPACGCGNFLIVAYRELRALELEILKRRRDLDDLDELDDLDKRQSLPMYLDASIGLNVTIDQFYGIEIEPWPARIAETAMFLIDHQANQAMENELGQAPKRLPITLTAHIREANALRMDWNDVLPAKAATFVFGNPPYSGARLRNHQQRRDMSLVWGDTPRSGTLDYVTCWFHKAAEYAEGHSIRIGLVATNSISQGEQPAILWRYLSGKHFHIDFAHRSFRWDNEASGQAAVHVVIVGFSQNGKPEVRHLWEYPHGVGTAAKRAATHINAYLADAPELLVEVRDEPLCSSCPALEPGSIPRDGGSLSKISTEEARAIRNADPIAARYLRRIYGSREHLQGTERWCLWLVDATPSDLEASPVLRKKLDAVRDERKGKPGAKGAAYAYPALFAQRYQPERRFLLVPSVSSQFREFIPISFYEPDQIITNAVFSVSTESVAHFGILSSRPFTVWVRAISSRMKSDYQISSNLVYNNFPFPDLPSDVDTALTHAAQGILDARQSSGRATLAELYKPTTMPTGLADAHSLLDSGVLATYGVGPEASDAEILSALFGRYEMMLDARASADTTLTP